MTTNNLPRIIYFERITVAPEGDPDLCPHCGAKGRYIYWFVCEDGHKYGAMSGCVKLFPWHRFAHEHKRILDKQRTKKKLCSWDEDMKAAIEKYASGEIGEREADNLIRAAKRTRESWMKRRRW